MEVNFCNNKALVWSKIDIVGLLYVAIRNLGMACLVYWIFLAGFVALALLCYCLSDLSCNYGFKGLSNDLLI